MRRILAVLFLTCIAALSAGETKPINVLIVGGGSSHDFGKWFNQADTALLSKDNLATVRYSDKPNTIGALLPELDVLYLSNNQPIADADVRKGIFDFATAGKGLLLVHPALWYNWGDWPDYNKVLCGGGSRGHDKFQEFEVTVEKADHPVMAGVSPKFKITDELYYFEPDPKGTPIEVLATAHSAQRNKTFPIVFIVKHEKAPIVGITLGHDGKAHDHPDYQKLLTNAVKWLAANKK